MRREPGQGTARKWFVKWIGLKKKENRSSHKVELSLEAFSYVLATYRNLSPRLGGRREKGGGYMIGKLLGLPFRILNAPVHATEKILDAMCGGSTTPKDERILSKPLDALAEAFEEIDE